MALTSGFFDSVDGDRRYDADQFSSFLDGIVYDGVYGAYGNCFYVMSNESEDLGIIIDTGRAWFNHTWTLNDTYYNLTMPEADLLLDRIDAVVIEVNKEDRQNSFQVVQGTPAESPVRPTLKGRSGEVTEEIYQYAIAYIARPAASTEVTQDQIVYVVDTSETPLCSALALAGIPSGGKIGQVLAKKSSESAAVDWYDIDKLPYGDNDWYLVPGILEENVIAAYRFKGAESEAKALININRNGKTYALTSVDVTWTIDKGLYFKPAANCYVNNTDLVNSYTSMVACAIGYSGLLNAAKCYAVGTIPYMPYNSTGKYLVLKANTYGQPYRYHIISTTGSGSQDGSSAVYYTDGCLSCDWATGNMYHNGIALSVSANLSINYNTTYWVANRILTSAQNVTTAYSPAYISALVFYNTSLTVEQHLALSNRINAL